MRLPRVLTVLTIGALSLAFNPADAQPPASPARKPEVWAVVVSVDTYTDPAIPRCPGAIRDGGSVARWLIETAGWNFSHVLLLNDSGAARHGLPEDRATALQPTLENMEWALRRWLPYRVRPGDMVVVYFAGQAFVGKDQDLLLPIDASADNVPNTGWSPENAIDALATKTQCSIAVWLDTALSMKPKDAPADQKPSTLGVRLLNRLARWPGVSAWLAAQGRPASHNAGRSPFVAALLKGLGARPNNLLACLDQMQQDPVLVKQEFRVRGGISPDLTLWPRDLVADDQFKPALLLQHGHADAITAAAFSADNELMLTASMDSTVRLWRVRDQERILLRVLPPHQIGVTSLALSPDGRFVASGDGAGRVRIWDLVQDRERRLLGPPPHVKRIVTLAFLPDRNGERLASLDQSGRTILWNTKGTVLKAEPLVSSEIVKLDTATREGPVAVALADADGKLTLLGADGQPRKLALPATGGRPTAMQLSADGQRLAIGDEEGRTRVWDLERGGVLFQHDYGKKISAVRLGQNGELFVAAENQLFVPSIGRDGAGPELEGTSDDVATLNLSPTGRWLAALTTAGDQRLWDLDDPQRPALRTPPFAGRSVGFTCVAFSRDGQRLVIGEGDGGVRSWDLPDLRERPRIPPHRGKVDTLDVSSDGRYLLQVTHDRLALLWDLKDGRGPRTIPGRWMAGVFHPDNAQLAMIRDPGQGGGIVLVDRQTGAPTKALEPPLARGGQGPSRATFGRVCVSRDGRKVAAAAFPGQVEIACVWNVPGDAPLTLRGHTAPLTSIGFSPDGRFLLTASEDGTTKLWDLQNPEPAKAPLIVLADPQATPVTAAQVSPTDAQSIVTAQGIPGRNGQVMLWSWKAGQAPVARPLGEVNGRVHSVAFTADGRWVSAAGQDGVVHLWTLDPNQGPARATPDPGRQHTEQVNALVAWPGAPMIVSGGDDSTVRFWELNRKTRSGKLLGSLSVTPPVAPEAPVLIPKGPAPAAPTADWVAFTPDGVFDASLNGDRAVCFVLGREVRPLEQYAEIFHRFQLTDEFRQGSCPDPSPCSAPPGLAIDPPQAPVVTTRELDLRISLSDASLKTDELRLYQNGVPVQDVTSFRVLDGPGHYSARVTLRSGANRFYAMAGRANDVDARSQDVEVRYDGQDAPGRLHILALGVKDYSRNSLRFADRDAVQLAEFLHKSGQSAAGDLGDRVVLTDHDVTEKKVEDAFVAMRRKVKGHPEDTVVVFLAGHTDVLKDHSGRERFSLLLPKFPFPEDAPRVAESRGAGVGARAGSKLPQGVDLPFYVIYRNVMQLEATQRLIIVDACQAEAIFDDPGVRQIQRVMEKDTRRARISYLLAARRGEAANESSLLEHGLLTYVLLRGMQAPGLRPLLTDLPIFAKFPTADRDGDGLVTTQELRDYADMTLSILANQLPDLARREGPSHTASPPQSPRLQGDAGASFHLISLPKTAGTDKQ